MCWTKGGSPKKAEGLLSIGARADNKKSAVIYGVMTRSPDHVKT
jgi:hypothetical protein